MTGPRSSRSIETLTSLLTTATTLEGIEALLTASHEQDILAAVKLVRKEVVRMAEEESQTPGRYDRLL